MFIVYIMDLFNNQTSVFSIKDMCLPAKAYFVLALLAVVFSGVMSFQTSTIIFSIIVLILWTFLLNWICMLGFKGISWALVVLPFIGILFTVVVAGETVNQSNRNNPNNLTGSAVSSLYDTIQTMSDQLNKFLGTPGPRSTQTGSNNTTYITMPAPSYTPTKSYTPTTSYTPT